MKMLEVAVAAAVAAVAAVVGIVVGDSSRDGNIKSPLLPLPGSTLGPSALA